MIHFVGDVHNEVGILQTMLRHIPSGDTVIQVGDFLTNPDSVWLPRRVDFVAGNHDPWSKLAPHRHAPEPVEISHHVWYNSQGLLRTIENYTIAFLGGAESSDQHWRTPGTNWWPDESIRPEDARRLEHAVDQLPKVDVLVTHTPPYSTVVRMLGEDRIEPRYQQSSMWVELLWDFCGRPPLVCGHLHPDDVFVDRQVRVLPMVRPIALSELFPD